MAKNYKERAVKALLSIPVTHEWVMEYNHWYSLSTAYKACGGSRVVWEDWCSGDPVKGNNDPKKWDYLKSHKTPAEEFQYLEKMAAKLGEDYTPELPSSSLEPWEQSHTQIKRLFQPGERIAVITACDARRNPLKPGPVQTMDQVCDVGLTLQCLDQYKDLYKALVGQSRMGDYPALNETAGAWVSVNPLDGKGFKDENVTSFRNMLIECDDLPKEEQYRALLEAGFPVATLTDSGGKSLHAIVQVNASGRKEYKKLFKKIQDHCASYGMAIDPACSNPARLTRLAGVTRNGTMQALLETDLGPIDPETGELQEFDEWAETAFMPDFWEHNEKGKPTKFRQDVMGEWLIEVLHIKRCLSGLYFYDKDSGLYTPDQEVLRARARKAVPSLSIQQMREVTACIQDASRAFRVSSTDDGQYMAFGNCLLDTQTWKTRPYGRDVFITSRSSGPYLPDYIPDTQTKDQVDKVFLEWAKGEKELSQLMFEWIGYGFMKAVPFHKFAIFTGTGRNGKSVLCDVMRAVYGPENCSSIPVSKLEGRFTTAVHRGKLANIAEENAGEFSGEGTVLKELSAGGVIAAEYKGKDGFEYRNFSKQTFCYNQPPTFRDSTGALKKRMIIIPFRACFEGREDPRLLDKLTTPEAVAYIIKKAIEAYKGVQARGAFSLPECVQAEIEEQHLRDNPVLAFIADRLEGDDDYFTAKAVMNIYREYTGWCIDEGLRPMHQRAFSSQVKCQLGLKSVKRSERNKTTVSKVSYYERADI